MTPPPTPYNDLNLLLATWAQQVHHLLKDHLVSIVLQGSFAVGDFDAHSDVDFIVITKGELASEHVDGLQQLHSRIWNTPHVVWAKHLEGSYMPLEVLRSLDRRSDPLWYLDHGSRGLIRSTHCNTALVRHVLREHGVVLSGPPVATLMDPIPVTVLRDEMRDIMVAWGHELLADPEPYANRFYQGFILLSYCRVWRDWTTGTVGSKRQGAAWALVRLGPTWAALVERAWDTRIDPARTVREPADPEDWAQTLALVEKVVAVLGS